VSLNDLQPLSLVPTPYAPLLLLFLIPLLFVVFEL
jgi:hypothetical protein